MMDTSHDYTVALYEASLDGSVSTLDTLMQRDRLILHKISLTSFTETPLHIAALLGHLQFTNALLQRKAQLVEKVDSSGRTALHLACAEGHTQVVKALLQANMDMCLVSDQEGRIPLHLAAMRGHVEVIKELLIAHPGSIYRVNLYGDNVLHLCVRYNCLDALKLLVESVNDEDFVNSKDNDGNSILHLAAMLGQMKVTCQPCTSNSNIANGLLNLRCSRVIGHPGGLRRTKHFKRVFMGHLWFTASLFRVVGLVFSLEVLLVGDFQSFTHF
ncbi:ankyrin repeat-containing protein At5g02620-like isoform X2 [Carya illinoinensis]|uniref:ankyrin repeat-containing protein At5g02620-like isoform X2 n=1 Tax=Carya illinoinensis TaxID=32201 RepID=UPI001C71E025|nr:ankyrin repeat-containing protein At5g02620-like isoform X2 [Carya illinoinensis]